MQMRDRIFICSTHDEYEWWKVNGHAEKGRLLNVLCNKASGAVTLIHSQSSNHAPPHQLTF